MQKFKIFSGRTMAAALSAAMLFQGTALAGPIDELNEIMEEQVEEAGDSLMEQTLGLSDLADAIEDHGIDFQLSAKLTQETLEMLDLADDEYAGECARFGFKLDPNLEKWMLTAGLGEETDPLLDASLYGDRDQLALILPQFYAGALALKAGNLKEQIVNSDLATILGMTPEDAAQIPDIDMTFYPDDMDAEDLFGGYGDFLEEQAEQLEDRVAVEKTEADGVVTYALTLEREMLMDVYRAVFREYMSVLAGAGMVFGTGENPSESMDAMIDQMLDVMGAGIPDQFTMYYEVRNNLVEKMYFEMPIDTAKIAEAQKDLESAEEEFAENLIESIEVEELAPAGEASDANGVTVVTSPIEVSDPDIEIETSEFKGTISFEMTYFEPAQPQKGFAVDMKMTEDATQESITIAMDFVTETQGTTETDTVTMELKENEETIYSGTVYTATFDAATGDLDAQILIEDEDTSVALKLDGTFTNVEKGKGFVLTVDELSMSVDGEKLGLEGEVSVKADPGEVPAPSDSRAVLELKQEELVGLVSEISANAYIWSMKFVPQTDSTVAVQ